MRNKSPEEPELYHASRYLAALSVLDYQGTTNVEDVAWYAHTKTSLEPELESLKELGLVEETEDGYRIKEEYEDEVETLAELVQIEYNGEWRNIELSDEKIKEIEGETDIIHWLV